MRAIKVLTALTRENEDEFCTVESGGVDGVSRAQEQTCTMSMIMTT
jgi:hypothetical protein